MRIVRLLILNILISMAVTAMLILFIGFLSWFVQDGAITFRHACAGPAQIISALMGLIGHWVIMAALLHEEENK